MRRSGDRLRQHAALIRQRRIRLFQSGPKTLLLRSVRIWAPLPGQHGHLPAEDVQRIQSHQGPQWRSLHYHHLPRVYDSLWHAHEAYNRTDHSPDDQQGKLQVLINGQIFLGTLVRPHKLFLATDTAIIFLLHLHPDRQDVGGRRRRRLIDFVRLIIRWL